MSQNVAQSSADDKPVAQKPVFPVTSAPEEKTYEDTVRKFWFAAGIAVPVLLLSLPDYFPAIREMIMGWHSAASIAAALSLPVLVWSGGSFFMGAWNSFRNHNANMDTLVALGTGPAWLYSAVYAVAPGLFPAEAAGMLFDVAVIVIALVLVVRVHPEILELLEKRAGIGEWVTKQTTVQTDAAIYLYDSPLLKRLLTLAALAVGWTKGGSHVKYDCRRLDGKKQASPP